MECVLLTMAIFTTLLALVSVVLRDLVPLKTRQNPDRADGLANLAMVLALAELGLTMTASLNGLADLPPHPLQSQEQRKSSGKSEYPFPVHYAILSSHFYLLASMTAKAAACLMCLRLMTQQKGGNENPDLSSSSASSRSSSQAKIATSAWHRRGYWTILIATVVISLLTLGLTTTATRARVGAKVGDKVVVTALRVHGAWSATTDLALALFPSLLLSRLAMLAKKRAALWGIMALGIIVAACAVVKCVHGDNLYKTILWGTTPEAIPYPIPYPIPTQPNNYQLPANRLTPPSSTSLEQNLGITALNLPTYTPLAASLRRVLTMTTTATPTTTTIGTTKTTTTAPSSNRHPSRPGEDTTIFMDSLSNMHGRRKGSTQRAQITIQSSSASSARAAGGGKTDKKNSNNRKNKGRVFLHALERLRSASPPREGGEANHLATGSQRNLIWCGSSDCAADCRSEKGGGDTGSSKRSQEGGSSRNLPRGQWTQNGIMKTVSVRVNSGENFDVELWELGRSES
ncbi:hypothetical protein PG985_008397 [Apiospora marii]|uniref:uncharacterized protein n=1 Tax=Apiospora marii TaxID=335849 RepID=UPI00312DB450